MNRVCQILIVLSLFILPAGAQDKQPRSDRVVGYWVSSTGTPVNVAYSGRAPTFLVRLYGGSKQQIRYEANWSGEYTFNYNTMDDHILGRYVPDSDTIHVHNKAGTFQAVWRRRN